MPLAARKSYLALTFTGCFGGGSLYGWSGYLPAVRAEFNVGNAAASMVFSLALVSFTLGVLLGPMALVRVPARFHLVLLTGLASISLGAAASAGRFDVLALAYGASFGFASGALYNHAISTASDAASATILVPASVAVFGLGGVVFGPVHVWLTHAGWGLWSVAPALACLAAVACMAMALSSIPEPNAPLQNRAATLSRPNRSLAILWIIFAAGSCSGLIVLGFAAQFLSQTNAGVGLASLAVFLAALGNTLGRLASAWTAGRFGPARGIAGALTLSIGTLAGLITMTEPVVVVVLLFLVAFAYGQLAATMPLLVKSQISGATFSTAFGWVFTGWGVAGLVGPWSAGWLLDATGTLWYALVACIALSVLGLGLVLRLAIQSRIQEQY